jgi:hypothetical protein
MILLNAVRKWRLMFERQHRREEWIMERKTMERRTVLKGGAAAIGMLGGASTAVVTGAEQASADAAQSPLPDQILAAIQRFRDTIPANFDRDYVEKAVIPFFLTSFYEGERPMPPVQTTSQEAWPEAEPLGWNNSLR